MWAGVEALYHFDGLRADLISGITSTHIYASDL